MTYKENWELKALAREQLKGKWLLVVVVCFIAWFLADGFTSDGARSGVNYVWQNGEFIKVNNADNNSGLSIINFILRGPIYFGLAGFFLKLARDENPVFSDLFQGFKYFLNNFILNFLIAIFTFLWFLLLIVPGFIAMLKYSMAYYIIYENPNIGAMEAIRQSKEMMEGHKMRLFELWISFLGWFLLGLLTMGIGFLWIFPYYKAAKVNFYEDLKYNALS